MNKTIDALKLAEEALNAMLTHMGMDEDEWTKPTFNQAREAIAAILEALAQPVKQEPVACQDSDDRRLLREIFMLCEATEEIEATNDFMRGRVFEAKGIRRGIGTWYQDTFCGRSYMGEPVIPAAPVDAKAIRAEALEEAAKVCRTAQAKGLQSIREAIEEAIRGLK